MEYEYRRQSQEPQRDDEQLRKDAIEKIEAARLAVDRYKDAIKNRPRHFVEREDERLKDSASKLLRESLFVGAAGEICTSCNGTGRRN